MRYKISRAFWRRFQFVAERHYKKLLPLISHELHALSNVLLISLQLERVCASVGRIYVRVRIRSLTAVLEWENIIQFRAMKEEEYVSKEV